MANDTSRRPWALDTPAVITTEQVRLKSLRWVSPAAVAGHAVKVEDRNGEVVWEAVATGANFQEESLIEEDVNGFELASISSGILYVSYA